MTALRSMGVAVLLCVAILVLPPYPALAGQIEKKTAHFHFEYAPEHAKAAIPLVSSAEAVRKRHCAMITPCFKGPILVRIAKSEDEFLDLQPYGAHLDWAAGVAYGELGLIILRIDRDMLLSLAETFEHEVSHILLLKAVKRRPPRWFIEGLAILQARQDLIERFERVAAATLSDGAFSLASIGANFPADPSGRSLAYAQSGLFVSYLRQRFGDGKLKELVKALSFGMTMEDAFVKVLGVPLDEVEEQWSGTLGSLAWLKAITSSWMLWSLISILFLVAVAVKYARTRRRKRQMVEEERDWEYRELH